MFHLVYQSYFIFRLSKISANPSIFLDSSLYKASSSSGCSQDSSGLGVGDMLKAGKRRIRTVSGSKADHVIRTSKKVCFTDYDGFFYA